MKLIYGTHHSFMWVWGSPFWVVDTWWVVIPKDVQYWFALKLIPVGCAQDTGKMAVFLALAPPTLEAFRILHEGRVC